MKITIVNGFFLPVPPVRGGATEKSWHRLAREFAAAGHEVVSFSRQWPGWPDEQMLDGVRHVRLPGFDHHRSRWRNLLRDLEWSRRVYRRLPPADVVVCNAVTLPLWLGRGKPAAGRVVVMCGRMPKGQYRRYSRLARVLAPSSLVREKVIAENPALAPVVRVTGYPIDWTLLHDGSRPEAAAREVTLGYVGRLHEEKGLLLLAEALRLLAEIRDLPPWKFVLCGPADVARGGSGPEFRTRLLARLALALPEDRREVLEPVFDDSQLAAVYRRMDIFCYPSLAEQGETFGVSAAEAMAAGAVPVVSDLACFRDFIRPGTDGVVFDHRAPDAAARLADALATLLRDGAGRRRLAAAAAASVHRFDFPAFARALLDDFATLARS